VLSAQDFYDYADEHFGWAETARTERERAIFFQMAAAWLEVAQRWGTSARRPAPQLLCCEHRSDITTLAALDFRNFGDQTPIAAVEKVAHCSLLRLQAEPGTPLSLFADAIIGDKLAGMRSATPGRLPPQTVACGDMCRCGRF
jgi:hypothetical protein